MIPNINEFLSSLGLTKKETIIYLASLKSGPQTGSTIAKKTGIPRSTVNFTFGELAKKGFVSKENREKTTYYSALPVETIGYMLMEKSAELKKQNRNFQELLPYLNSVKNKLSTVPKVRYFEGLEGLQRIVDDSCEVDEEVFFISGHNMMHPKLKEYVENVYVPRIAKYKSGSKMIVNEGVKSRTHVGNLKKNRNTEEVLFVDPKEYSFTATTVVHGSKVSFASYDPRDMTGIIIENQFIADQMKEIFRALWSYFSGKKGNS